MGISIKVNQHQTAVLENTKWKHKVQGYNFKFNPSLKETLETRDLGFQEILPKGFS